MLRQRGTGDYKTMSKLSSKLSERTFFMYMRSSLIRSQGYFVLDAPEYIFIDKVKDRYHKCIYLSCIKTTPIYIKTS